MKADLKKRGISEENIIEDRFAERTNDSIKNLINNGYTDVVLISQKFHLERSIFLAAIKGYSFFGFEAESPN
jgi:SanA protein